MPRTVCFDLDGTLTDPKPGITRCIQHALQRLRMPVPEADALEWCIGPPLRESFAALLNTHDAARLDHALSLYRERFGEIGLYENTLYPDIPAAVRELRAAGYRTLVATSKPEIYAVRIIEHFSLTELFDRVYGSELDGSRADKSELLAHVLAGEGLSPADAVMIGDREHDARGARRRGMACIGVTWGYGSEAELREHGAALIAARPADIPALVRRHFDDCPGHVGPVDS